jgi:hypothetical protein
MSEVKLFEIIKSRPIFDDFDGEFLYFDTERVGVLALTKDDFWDEDFFDNNCVDDEPSKHNRIYRILKNETIKRYNLDDNHHMNYLDKSKIDDIIYEIQTSTRKYEDEIKKNDRMVEYIIKNKGVSK